MGFSQDFHGKVNGIFLEKFHEKDMKILLKSHENALNILPFMAHENTDVH